MDEHPHAHCTTRFLASYADAPAPIRRAADRRAVLLSSNLRHPSFRATKYDEVRDFWQARVTVNWRLRFRIMG